MLDIDKEFKDIDRQLKEHIIKVSQLKRYKATLEQTIRLKKQLELPQVQPVQQTENK